MGILNRTLYRRSRHSGCCRCALADMGDYKRHLLTDDVYILRRLGITDRTAMAKIDRRYIHAVNADGIRRIIPNPNYASHDSDKDMNEGYFFDDDWYLTHGYVTIEQHRENLKIALGQMQKRYGRNG